MAISFVASDAQETATVGTALDAACSTTASSGNLLLAGLVQAAPDAPTATGWTLLQSTSVGGQGSFFYYRIANGTSTDDFNPTWTSSTRAAGIIMEFSGQDATPLDGSGSSSTTNTNDTIAPGSQTPSQADGLSVSWWSCDDSDSWSTSTSPTGTGISINDSFTGAVYSGNASANRPWGGMAYHIYSSTAAKNPTWSGDTSVGGLAFAALQNFKAAAAGGANPKGPFGLMFHGPFGGPV